MNTFAKACALILVGLTISINSALSQTVLDEWWTPGFSARVKLAPCLESGEERLCGTIIWAWDDTPAGVSDKRPLVGQRIINGMKRDPEKADKGDRGSGERSSSFAGSIYNPEDGHTYKASMRLKSPNTLLVEGCVLFVCREQVWRRYDSLRSPPVSLK
jgi:uncharacterized protein (DUF2147 family)